MYDLLPELEKDIQSSICEYLEILEAQGKIMFWRQNTAPTVNKNKGGEWSFRKMPKFTKKGVPDIIMIVKGKFIGLEVKTKKGVQSQDQKDFQALVEKNQGEYHVVRSIEDVLKIIK